VKLLTPDNPLFTAPNAITPADFDGWVEERGHSFLESWDPAYAALTETADPGQDPQRGGWWWPITAREPTSTFPTRCIVSYRSSYPEPTEFWLTC